MSGIKNDYEDPVIMPEGETLYETTHGNKLQLGSSKNILKANNRMLLIYTKNGYKSLFYDKMTAVNVKKGFSQYKLEISLLGAKEPESISLSKKAAVDLFNIVSNLTSLSNDSRLAYAIGSLEAQKMVKEKEQEMMGALRERQMAQLVMHSNTKDKSPTVQLGVFSSTQETNKSRIPGPDYLEQYSKKHEIKVEAKNSEGKSTGISFNFVPKVKGIITSRLNSEALYTLANGMYSGSSIVAGLLYGSAKSAGKTLSATMSSTLKQAVKEDYAKNAYALKCVALNNIQHSVELEGNPAAYVEALYLPDIPVEEFTNNIYNELGAKLAGLEKSHEEQKQEAHETKVQDVEPVHTSTIPMANMLRTAHYEQAHLTAHTNSEAHIQATPKWKPEEKMIIFQVREHKRRSGRFTDLIKKSDN
jgi:hypothetical protein